MCALWLVINGKQAFVYLLTLCVLEHFVLSHYFWEAFSYCEPRHFLNFKKFFCFLPLLSTHSWFWNHFLFVCRKREKKKNSIVFFPLLSTHSWFLNHFMFVCRKRNAKFISKVRRLSSSHGAVWAAVDCGRSLWPVLLNILVSFSAWSAWSMDLFCLRKLN